MRHFLALTCLLFATACAGLRASTINAPAAGPNDHEGMQLSHSEPDAPHCFTAVDNRLICPEGGAPIYSANDAQVHHTPATMELDPNCNGANATAQCVIQPAALDPAVAEDSAAP